MRQPLWLQSPLTAASAIAAKSKIHLYSTNDLLAGLLLFTTISRRTVARVIPLNKARCFPILIFRVFLVVISLQFAGSQGTTGFFE